MSREKEDALMVLNTAMLAMLVFMNWAWHYGYL
jgi:hypothetical protein